MTITTAKRLPTRIARVPRLAPLAAALALIVALPAQAQWNVTPSLSLTETYSDNPSLTSDANKRAQWITEARPAIAVTGQNSRVQLQARASSAFYSYSEGRPANARRNNIQYDASGRLKVIDELFYVDARTHASTRAIDAFGPDDSGVNRYTNENRTELTNWSVSPYLMQRFGNFAAATLRYTHDRVTTDLSRYGQSTGNTGTFDLVSGRAWRDLGWNVHYTRQDLQTDEFGDSMSENAVLGLSYALNRTFRLTATGGYDRYDYAALDNRTAGASWSVGFGWAPSARTALQMAVGRHFLGNTGNLTASHRSRHSVWQLNYSDGVTNTRQQFTQTTTVDTFALIDALFAVTIPDPVARRRVVEDYLLSTGLPLSTAESVNYLTNRYFRQKQARASVAFNKRAHSTVFSAYANERVALSTGEADAGLLGSELFALNDNVRQLGASLSHSYRLNARSSATASLTTTRNRSLSTAIDRNQQSLRLGMTRRFSRKLLGTVELRHLRGERAQSATNYTENAISATLSAQL